jgi:osmoprotectant transport system permease protein
MNDEYKDLVYFWLVAGVLLLPFAFSAMLVDFNIITDAAGEHLILAYASLFISIIISLPLAIAALYNKYLAEAIIGFANLVQSIPSLAVIALIIPFLGIGFTPAIIVIVLRALLPIIKNTYIGLKSVDPVLIDSAKGIGMSDWQIIRHVRIPNSYPAIFAGIKFASIMANSVAILTAYIGTGGFGELVRSGFSNFNTDKILGAVLPVMGIAIGTDLILSLIERKLDKND